MTEPNWAREATRSVPLGGATVGYDRLRRPDGERARYGWLDAPDSVAVVAAFEGELVLIEEYRPRLGESVLSCPVGGVEDGESFTEAGARELREETGFRAERVQEMETYDPVSWLRKRRGVVFADGLTPGDQDLEESEFVSVRTVPVERGIETVREGRTTGWTLLPILLAREEGLF